MHINMRNPTYSQDADEQVFSPFKIPEDRKVGSKRNSIEQLIQSVTFLEICHLFDVKVKHEN